MAPSTQRKNGKLLRLAVVLLFSTASRSYADFGWLVDEVKVLRSQRGATTEVVVSAAEGVEDRAGVFIREGNKTELQLLFKGFTGRPTQVLFHGSTPVPSVTDLPQLPPLLPSGLPRPLPVLDRNAIAGNPHFRPAVVVTDLLVTTLPGCSRIIVYDDVLIALNTSSPGNLASQSELYHATVSPLDQAGTAAASRSISHLHVSSVAVPARLLSLIKDPPDTNDPIRSFGHDSRLGYDFCSAGSHFYYRPMTVQGTGGWVKKQFAADTDIRILLDKCLPLAGASHREKASNDWVQDDIDALKALACLDQTTAMSAWHRHPRFYTQSR